ncbi:MAG: hypothetical protein SFV15_19580 [Polyangiaceae bacterium]|nr:hypothetical protein [Polyangiaceae bacterium]
MMKLSIPRRALLPLALFVSACAPGAGTQAHDMSAARHLAAAKQEDDLASQHAPGAREPRTRCTPSQGRVCWTGRTDTPDGHQHTAEEHLELAAKHRAASKELMDAEAHACAGLSDEDRDTSPFAHSADIESVTELRENARPARVNVGRDAATRLAGATIVFRASPGLTVEWLQRIVDCHLARNVRWATICLKWPIAPSFLAVLPPKFTPLGVGLRSTSARTTQRSLLRSGNVPNKLEQSNDELS